MNKFLSGLSLTAMSLVATAAQAASDNGGQPGLPQLHVNTFVGQWFWLVISFGILFLIMWKVALPRLEGVIENRQERIAGDLDKAQQLKAEAEKLLADYEARLSGARSKAQGFLAEARDAATKDSADKLVALEASLAQKAEDAEAALMLRGPRPLPSCKALPPVLRSISSTRLPVSKSGKTRRPLRWPR